MKMSSARRSIPRRPSLRQDSRLIKSLSNLVESWPLERQRESRPRWQGTAIRALLWTRPPSSPSGLGLLLYHLEFQLWLRDSFLPYLYILTFVCEGGCRVWVMSENLRWWFWSYLESLKGKYFNLGSRYNIYALLLFFFLPWIIYMKDMGYISVLSQRICVSLNYESFSVAMRTTHDSPRLNLWSQIHENDIRRALYQTCLDNVFIWRKMKVY